jgi:hypothetical protein
MHNSDKKQNMHNSILFNERITMAITHENDFVSGAEGE